MSTKDKIIYVCVIVASYSLLGFLIYTLGWGMPK